MKMFRQNKLTCIRIPAAGSCLSDRRAEISDTAGQCIICSLRDQDFSRFNPRQLIMKTVGIVNQCYLEFTSGQVHDSQAELSVLYGNSSKIDIAAGLHTRLKEGSRSDDSDYVSLYYTFGSFGIFQLLANGDFEALTDKFFQISVDRMIRNPAHRNGVFRIAVSRCQGDLQNFGSDLGVLAKKFIKIS